MKVLKPDPSHPGTLPEEAHSSKAYILLDPEGNFRMIREYDDQHYVRREVAYHYEPHLAPQSIGKILHIHDYLPNDFTHREPRLLTEREYRHYRPYFGKELTWKI